MRLPRPALAALAAVAASAVAVPLAGCGADDLNPDAVAQAAEKTAAAESMRFRMTSSVAAEEMLFDGYVQMDPLRLQGTMDMPPLGKLEVVMDDEAMYMAVPEGMGDAFGAGDAEWLRIGMKEVTGADLGALTSGGLGATDPVEQMRVLKAMGDIEAVGEEEVDGVQTTHYRGEIDLRKAAEHADPALREAAKRSIEALVAEQGGEAVVPTEVWVDDDSLIRRMKQSVPGDAGFEMTMDFSDFGAAEDVEIPSGDDVVDITEEIAAP